MTYARNVVVPTSVAKTIFGIVMIANMNGDLILGISVVTIRG